MKKFQHINIQGLLIIIIFLLQIVLVIFGITILSKIDNRDINKIGIEYDAETIEEIDKLKEERKPIIVVFGADYCPTCRNYLPYIKELAKTYKDKVIIKYVDTAKHQNIRKLYNIEIIPSTIIYDANGEAYKPSENIDVYESKEVVEDRKYISEDIVIKTGESLGLNNNFEYGLDKKARIVYTKYVGLIDIIQLENIIEDLLK